jgi:hypothetical protein
LIKIGEVTKPFSVVRAENPGDCPLLQNVIVLARYFFWDGKHGVGVSKCERTIQIHISESALPVSGLTIADVFSYVNDISPNIWRLTRRRFRIFFKVFQRGADMNAYCKTFPESSGDNIVYFFLRSGTFFKGDVLSTTGNDKWASP